jgi:hypothetical protein
MTVSAVHPWRTNAELMADVHRLGYINDWDVVLDLTYGVGRFWADYCPPNLMTNDKYAEGALFHDDFRATGFDVEQFDVVVLDPPYKLNGTPHETEFEHYGITTPMKPIERMDMIHQGIKEASRLLKPGGIFLLKCQDQVCSGRVWWQTDEFTEQALTMGLRKVDRFDMTGHAREQPMGPSRREIERAKAEGREPRCRRQVHAHGRPSTLLVFKKGK